jgi:hypothetical protein
MAIVNGFHWDADRRRIARIVFPLSLPLLLRSRLVNPGAPSMEDLFSPASSPGWSC